MKTDRRWWNDGRLERECTLARCTSVGADQVGRVLFEPDRVREAIQAKLDAEIRAQMDLLHHDVIAFYFGDQATAEAAAKRLGVALEQVV